jgi:hypothetical protein
LLIALVASISRLSPGRIVVTVAASLSLLGSAVSPGVHWTVAAMRVDYSVNSEIREAVVSDVMTHMTTPGYLKQSGGSLRTLLPAFVPTWRRGLVSAGGTVDVVPGNGAVEIDFHYVRGFTNVNIVYESDDSEPDSLNGTIAHLAPHWWAISTDTGAI